MPLLRISSAHHPKALANTKYWLIAPGHRQAAVRYCRLHVLYRELVAVVSNDLPLTPAQMLELAPVLQQTGSPLMTAVVV